MAIGTAAGRRSGTKAQWVPSPHVAAAPSDVDARTPSSGRRCGEPATESNTIAMSGQTVQSKRKTGPKLDRWALHAKKSKNGI